MKSVFLKTIPFSVFMLLGVNAYSQKVYELSDLSGSVNVTVKGKPKKGVKINLYGSRAQFNDQIPVPYRTYVTGKDGKVFITGVPDLYDQPERPINTDELPYNRWFTFVLEAEYKGEKKYVWLPEYEVQRAFFKGEKTYSVDVKF